MIKLDSYMHSTKISPEFECQDQRSRSQGLKTKKCGILFGSRPLGARSSCSIVSGVVLWGAATPVGKSAHAV